MQLISKHNKGIRYLLRAIDLFSKYAFVVPINKIWVDQGGEFYNKHFKNG